MKISLRKIRVSRSLSEETIAFTADVLVDGKPVGYASNHGTGGNTDVHVYTAIPHAERAPLIAKVADAARAWIVEHGDDDDRALLVQHEGSSYTPDPIEFAIDLMVERHLAEQDAKREAKRTERTEQKNARMFEAKGFPFMLRVRFADVITWFGIKSAAPDACARVIEKATAKYGTPIDQTVIQLSPKEAN